MGQAKLKPVHPGEILLEEFLKPMNLSQNQMALALRVPARRINQIVHSKRRISTDTALHLARYFDRSPRFWLGLQIDHDLDVAEDEMGDRPPERQLVGCWGARIGGNQLAIETQRGR